MIELPPPAGRIEGGARERERPVEVLTRHAASAQYFRSCDGPLFARVPVEEGSEVYGLRTDAFLDWLTRRYFRDCRTVPPEALVRRVIAAIDVLARVDGDGTPPAFVRTGCDGNGDRSTYYIDVGDSSGQTIQMSPQGWALVDRPGVNFRRPEGLLPLAVPAHKGGSIELLRPYVNLTDLDFQLLVVWLAAAIRPVGPYPILAVCDEKGAGESTLPGIVRLLIDPRARPLLGDCRNMRDVMARAVDGWLLVYESMGSVPGWLADGLCLLARRSASAGRCDFSHDHQTLFDLQRPAILYGEDGFVRTGELLDRCVVLNVLPVALRDDRHESEFWHAFSRERARIFGGLLDAVAGALRELASATAPDTPCMVDLAAFAQAVGRALGWKAPVTLPEYFTSFPDSGAAQIEHSPLGRAILDRPPEAPDWTGTASSLLKVLNRHVGTKVASSPVWPKSPEKLTKELRRIAPQLRLHGLDVVFHMSQKKSV